MIPAPFESLADRRAILDAMGATYVTLTGTKSGIPDTQIQLDFRVPDSLPGYGDIQMESTEPYGYTVDEDIQGVRHGDTVTVDNVSYTIRQIHSDGTGITKLMFRQP